MSDDDTGKGKIFCIGFPKTGTTSLEVALVKLGYKVCRGNGQNTHSNYLMALCVHGDYPELERVIRHFDAFADLPWGGSDMYLWLSRRYPEARFIQTERDPDDWYESVLGSALKYSNDLEATLDTFHSLGRYGAVLFLNRVWGIDSMSNAREKLLDYYVRNNQAIKDHFAGTDRLLSVHLVADPRWDEICAYLDKPVPDIPFPEENMRKKNGAAKQTKVWS